MRGDMIKFKLNGAREKQVFYFKNGDKVERYTLGEGELPDNVFEYARKKFSITEDKPKVYKPKIKKDKGDE